MSILVCDLCGKDHNVQNCKIFFDNGKSVDPGSSQFQIPLAYQTLPNWVFLDENQRKIIACKEIDVSFKIGPFLAPQSSILKDNIAFPLYLDLPNNIKLWLDQSDRSKCNWLSLIPPSLHNYNMVACQMCDNIYFVVVRPIKIGQDLKVWYAPFYKLKIPEEILERVTLSLKGDKAADENGEVNVTSLIDLPVKVTDDNGSLYCQPSLFNDTQLLESPYIPNSTITGNESISIPNAPKVIIASSTVASTLSTTSTSILPLNSSQHSLFVVPLTHSNALTPINSAFGESYLYNSLPCFPLNMKVNEIIPVTSQNFTTEENILQVLPTHNSFVASSENIVTLESQGNISNFSKASAEKIKKRDNHSRNHFNLHSLQQITVGDNKITFTHRFSKNDLDKSTYSPSRAEHQQPTPNSPKSNYVDIKNKNQTKTIIVKMRGDGVKNKKHSTKLWSNRSDICLVPHSNEIQLNFAYDMISLSIMKKDKSNPFSEALGYRILKKQKALDIPDKKSQYDVTSSRPPSLPNHWTCSFCQDTFTDKLSFAFHLKNHLQIKLGHRFACRVCKLQFKNQDHLKAHLKSCSSSFKPEKGTLLAEHSGPEDQNIHSTLPTKEQPSPIGVDGTRYPGLVCEICLKQFNNLKYLLRHYSKHCGEFVCSLCKKEFARKENLRKHMCVQQSQMSGLRCDICRKTFSSLHLHKLHLKQHREKVNCERCGQIFLNENSLSKHEKVCSPTNGQEPESSKASHKEQIAGAVENSRFCCHVCSRSFSSYFFLKNHAVLCEKLADASEKGAVNCEICSTLCAGASDLRTHVQLHTHPYHCLSCSQRFRARGSYELHICLVPFSCDWCDSSLRSLQDLYKHVTSHGPPPLCCSRCRYPFYKMESLKHHRCQVEVSEATSEGSERKRICCPACPALFRSEYSVKKHMASLHGTPIKPFVCRKCGKTFHRSDLLRGHEKTHMAPSLECRQCLKKFKSQRSLSNHAALHTQAFRFTCPHCHKGFAQKKDASRHEKTHVSPLSVPRPRPCFKCSECQASFQTNDQLRVHLGTHNSRA